VTGILEWLQELGLERYAAVFAEHEITLDILPDLTETDVDRLGLPTGPRRRLIVAIRALAAAARAKPSGLRVEALSQRGGTQVRGCECSPVPHTSSCGFATYSSTLPIELPERKRHEPHASPGARDITVPESDPVRAVSSN
jgi:hypothetical protein